MTVPNHDRVDEYVVERDEGNSGPGAGRSEKVASIIDNRPVLPTVRDGLRNHRAALLAAAAYLIYACIVTWPLALSLQSGIAAPPVPGDPAGGVAVDAYLVQHRILPFLPAHFSAWNAPGGLAQPWVLNWVAAPSVALTYLPSLVFGAVAGTGLSVIATLTLDGLVGFLITRRLFGSTPAAALAGFVLAFNPFSVANARSHYALDQSWLLLVMVYLWVRMMAAPSRTNALLAGLASALAMWFSPYFTLFGAVAFATLTALALVLERARPAARLRSHLVLAAAPTIALGAFFAGLVLLAGGAAAAGVQTRSLSDLYTYGARLFEFVVPDAHNLLFTGMTGPFLAAHRHGSNFAETSLYVGVSVLLVAAAGGVLLVRRLRREGRPALADPACLAVIAGAVIAAVAFVFSFPPAVSLLGVHVRFPSGLIFRFTSTWRVFSRFEVLVEVGLTLVFAYGVARIAGRWPGRRGVGLVTALGVIVVLDLWAIAPVRVFRAVPAPAYRWLARHPGGIVADYPLQDAQFGLPSVQLLWQTFDRHPLFNGWDYGSTDEAAKLDLADLASPRTAGELADYGVRFIVVHPGVLGANPAALRARGYQLAFRGRAASVWLVRARPARTRVDALTGFDSYVGNPSYAWRRLVGGGEIGGFARGCASCAAAISFRVRAVGQPSTIVVQAPAGGPVLARANFAPGRPATVRVTGLTLHRGTVRLHLSARAGGKPVYADLADGRMKLGGG